MRKIILILGIVVGVPMIVVGINKANKLERPSLHASEFRKKYPHCYPDLATYQGQQQKESFSYEKMLECMKENHAPEYEQAHKDELAYNYATLPYLLSVIVGVILVAIAIVLTLNWNKLFK